MFLMIDNFDSFTFNLVQAFQQLGADPVVIRNDRHELLDLAGSGDLTRVCVSPGPGRPEGAGLCLKFLELLPKDVPVLGVCLGHQVLGAFAGAPVEVAGRIMHGKVSMVHHEGTGLFTGLPDPFKACRYHSLLVRAHMAPHLLEVTARTDRDEVMAMRYKDRPWYGVQFHPESVFTPNGPDLLDNFLKIQKEKTGPARIIKPVEEKKMHTGISETLENLASGMDLSPEAADASFADLFSGGLAPSQAGAFLMGLRAKGETATELASAVKAALREARLVSGLTNKRIDTCGTGGDNKSCFNCSTAVALYLAGMGYDVVKHGNRAVSSSCGSADAVEALGLPLQVEPDDAPGYLKKHRFVFLFAPAYHPAFAKVAPIRKELGIRTLFNLMGPLLNPARPTHQLLGVAKGELLELIAEALRLTGVQRAAVIHGGGGYDELTAMGPSRVAWVTPDTVKIEELDPYALGFSPCKPEQLTVSGKDQAIDVIRELLAGKGPEPMREMIVLNLAVALHLLEDDMDLPMAVAKAREAVGQGLGMRIFDA